MFFPFFLMPDAIIQKEEKKNAVTFINLYISHCFFLFNSGECFNGEYFHGKCYFEKFIIYVCYSIYNIYMFFLMVWMVNVRKKLNWKINFFTFFIWVLEGSVLHYKRLFINWRMNRDFMIITTCSLTPFSFLLFHS